MIQDKNCCGKFKFIFIKVDGHDNNTLEFLFENLG